MTDDKTKLPSLQDISRVLYGDPSNVYRLPPKPTHQERLLAGLETMIDKTYEAASEGIGEGADIAFMGSVVESERCEDHAPGEPADGYISHGRWVTPEWWTAKDFGVFVGGLVEDMICTLDFTDSEVETFLHEISWHVSEARKDRSSESTEAPLGPDDPDAA